MRAETIVVPFSDNWTYLKAELAWLDRVLMRAMSKQRQTNGEVDRVARSAADKATSHWWKGFLHLDPAKGGSLVKSEFTDRGSAHPLGRYGDRIAESLDREIDLALPKLCQHLGLNKFERDAIVLCLAPEISRRYEKLYAFLNNDEANCRQPTVDLALRLFCRSDAEWRSARDTFYPKAPLVKNKVLEIHQGNTTARSLLSRSLQLSDKFANYLLSEDSLLEDVLPRKRGKRSAKTT